MEQTPQADPMRRFRLHRQRDVTGVSGTGIVAEGVQFTDGSIVVRWLTTIHTTVLYDRYADLEAITLHGGATVVCWLDPAPRAPAPEAWGAYPAEGTAAYGPSL